MDRGSIFIARIRFSRDTSSIVKPRQFIVISNDRDKMFFLETEKTLKKRKFNVANISKTKEFYHIFNNEESKEFGFNYPTAVNCREVFICDYFPAIHNLKHRDLPLDVVDLLIEKVKSLKLLNKNLPDVLIRIDELKEFNPKAM